MQIVVQQTFGAGGAWTRGPRILCDQIIYLIFLKSNVFCECNMQMQILCKTWHLSPRTTQQGPCGTIFLGFLLDQDSWVQSKGKIEIKDWKNNAVMRDTKVKLPVLGTCATFMATATLERTKKGGARLGCVILKNNGAVAVAQNKWRFFAPFSNQILYINLIKIANS